MRYENGQKLKNIHPGEILRKELPVPLNITAYRLSKGIRIPQTRISEILRANRRITADTALRFSKYFGNNSKFWLGFYDDFDIEEERGHHEDELNAIRQFTRKAA